MFKLPALLPTSKSNVDELTDYIEWQCILKGSISFNEVIKPIALINDEMVASGIEDESDQWTALLDDVQCEIERRFLFTNKRYPFKIERHGYRLSVINTEGYYWVYVYLLLCTRLNMTTASTWQNINGTELFEELSAIVAKQYFGERSESLVFGTAAKGGFQKKVDDLCIRIGEGKGYINRSNLVATANDDKLDVVVWINFSDNQWSKLIAFGQCKTGTSWDDGSTIELQPIDFCKKWFINSTIISPVKMFFCSQYFPINNYAKVTNAGVVFDRFRILDFLPDSLDSQFLGKIKAWCNSAIIGISKDVVQKNVGKASARKTASRKKSAPKESSSVKSQKTN